MVLTSHICSFNMQRAAGESQSRHKAQEARRKAHKDLVHVSGALPLSVWCLALKYAHGLAYIALGLLRTKQAFARHLYWPHLCCRASDVDSDLSRTKQIGTRCPFNRSACNDMVANMNYDGTRQRRKPVELSPMGQLICVLLSTISSLAAV